MNRSSDLLLNEDDESLRKAMALSLITAREDELRRRQLYRSVEAIPQHVANEMAWEGLHASSSYPNLTDDSAKSTNTIARPRPQGKLVNKGALNLPVSKPPPPCPRSPRHSRVVPVVPPRPNIAAVSPPKQRLSSNQDDIGGNRGTAGHIAGGVPPRPIVGPHGRTSAKIPPPRPHTIQPSGATPPKADVDMPLITLSPRILPNSDDFDVSSLDPLCSTSSYSSGATSASFGEDLRVALNRPGGSAVPATRNSTIAAPVFESSSSFGMAAALSYPLCGGTGSVATGPSYPPRGSTGSGAASPSFPSSIVTGLPPVGPFYPQRVNTGSTATASSYKPFDHIAADNEINKLLFIDNDLFNTSHKAPIGKPHADTPASDVAIPVSLGEYNYVQPEDAVTSYDIFNTCDNADDNLMQFAAGYDHHELLTLECFDPLYSVEQPASSEDAASTPDSLELFPNPFDKFERKETPNPFPVVDPASTHKLLLQSSVSVMSRQSNDVTGDIDVTASKGHTRNESSGSNSELMDPFSIDNLTSALERKRKKHEKEQKERKTLLRKNAVKIKEEKASRPTASRPTYSRQSSYLSKGQVRHESKSNQQFVGHFCGDLDLF